MERNTVFSNSRTLGPVHKDEHQLLEDEARGRISRWQNVSQTSVSLCVLAVTDGTEGEEKQRQREGQRGQPKVYFALFDAFHKSH